MANKFSQRMRKQIEIWNSWESDSSKHFPFHPEDFTLADAERITDDVEGLISPENVSCDGELPESEVKKELSKLKKLKKELQMFKLWTPL